MIRTIIFSSNRSSTWRFLFMRGTLKEPLFTAPNLSAWKNVNVLQERCAHTSGNGNEVNEKETRQSHSEGSEGKDNLQLEGNAQKQVENTSKDNQVMLSRVKGPKLPGPDKGSGAQHYK